MNKNTWAEVPWVYHFRKPMKRRLLICVSHSDPFEEAIHWRVRQVYAIRKPQKYSVAFHKLLSINEYYPLRIKNRGAVAVHA